MVASPRRSSVFDGYDVTHAWTLLTSQVIYLPAARGTTLVPSGRLPSLRRRPRAPLLLLILLLLRIHSAPTSIDDAEPVAWGGGRGTVVLGRRAKGAQNR